MSASLRSQLLGPLLWAWLLGSALAIVGAFQVARYAGDAAYDRTLQDEAGAIATQINWTDRGPLLELSTQAQQLLARHSEDRNAYMVSDAEGRILSGVGDLPMSREVDESFERPVLFDAVYLGEPVRGAMYSIRSPMLDQYVSIVVVETRRKRTELIQDVLLAILLPTLMLGVVTFLLLAWGIRRGLAPLHRVAAEVERREVQDLRPLPLDDVPAEVVPLIERINDLLVKVSRSVDVQRRFVADAAHQLRTPVAGIRVLAQQLQQELGGDPAAAQSLLQVMVGSTERMSRLVGQLLNLVRSEAAMQGTGGQEAPRIDVLPIIHESAEPFVLQATREGKQVELDAPQGPCWARAHPVWLGEVVSNLLDNALRYGGRCIEVKVVPRGERLEIQVWDDGEGIPPGERASIFEPFARGGRADTRAVEGSGLGLTIVKEAVQGMGGQVHLESRPEVPGTCFSVVLRA
ncbi:MAG TPA: sensor histidine kinase [Burkholderiaceae bacterium]|nr:sensor histidine kinase [Burkholderiaceae bacterium]